MIQMENVYASFWPIPPPACFLSSWLDQEIGTS